MKGQAASPRHAPYILSNPDGAWRSVFCGRMWQNGVDLGACWWDAWVQPNVVASNQGYIVSGGSGGRHPVLFGLPAALTLPWAQIGLLGGNFCDANGDAVSYASADGPVPKEWMHLAIGWDGANIWTYVNGVPSSKQAWVGERRALAVQSVHRTLWVFGSDHSNWNGRIASVRGFEGVFAHPEADTEHAFSPTWPPSPEVEAGASEGAGCNFLMEFLADGEHGPVLIPDLSPTGYNNGTELRRHPGRVRGEESGGYIRPRYQLDSSFPFALDRAPLVPTQGTPTAASVPVGAGIFDAFRRRHQTLAFVTPPSIGATAGGSAGALTWQSGPVAAAGTDTNQWGILCGQLVFVGRAQGVTWVVPASQPQDVRVTRRYTDTGSPRPFGIAFRVVDRSNFYFVYPSGTTRTNLRLKVGRFIAGVSSPVDGQGDIVDWICPTSNWDTLRVTDNGSTLTGYCDATQVGQLTGQTTNAAVKGVGLFPGLQSGVAQGLDRASAFTVYF